MGFPTDVAASRILPLKFYIHKASLVKARSVYEIHRGARVRFALEQPECFLPVGVVLLSCNRKQGFLNLFPVHIPLGKP